MKTPHDFGRYVAAIDAAAPEMEARLLEWANINSGSGNAAGLGQMANRLATELRRLGAEVTLVPLAGAATPASVVRARCRPDAPRQVLLNGHFDTVYESGSAFQWCTQVDDDTVRGPGVADMKGGLVVLLEALRAFEASPQAAQLGWEVFLVPDEETGSTGSGRLLQAAAEKHQLGIVVEPALADGSIIGSRKGGGVVKVTAHGRAAHSGRDFASGRNAIVALARFVGAANGLNSTIADVVVNVGRISGGGPVNIVPDHAVAEINVRATHEAAGGELLQRMHEAADAIARALDVRLELEGGFVRPPMATTPASQALLDAWCATARALGTQLKIGHSGGGSDANLLVAAGLPCIDGAGVEGGDLHSEREWVRLSSLTRRAKIAAAFLLRLATGEIAAPGR